MYLIVSCQKQIKPLYDHVSKEFTNLIVRQKSSQFKF